MIEAPVSLPWQVASCRGWGWWKGRISDAIPGAISRATATVVLSSASEALTLWTTGCTFFQRKLFSWSWKLVTKTANNAVSLAKNSCLFYHTFLKSIAWWDRGQCVVTGQKTCWLQHIPAESSTQGWNIEKIARTGSAAQLRHRPHQIRKCGHKLTKTEDKSLIMCSSAGGCRAGLQQSAV